MAKEFHEIRDPIHVFVRLDSAERQVLDSLPLQRLRSIHQLALTHFVYPSATHKRFEHSIGVMELAGRVFDTITNSKNITDRIRNNLTTLTNTDQLNYWRRVLRMAALCHDIGHLPFSHAAEAELLPEGWSHERITRDLINSEEMKAIWTSIVPPLEPEHIVKLAIGPKHADDLEYSSWEMVLSEVIVGDAFGVDRIDYLLRDSHHTGVAYGRFDHHRLVDTLRILPSPQSDQRNDELHVASASMPTLGVQEGGLQSAEALLLARYFMYTQVYFHPIRRIYDIHLMDFLKNFLKCGRFGTNTTSHLALTDDRIFSEIFKAFLDDNHPNNRLARRIMGREHFKCVYSRNASDIGVHPEAGRVMFEALREEFGLEFFRRDWYRQRSGAPHFPVEMRDGRIESSVAISAILESLPLISVDFVFADRDIYDEVVDWIVNNRVDILKRK